MCPLGTRQYAVEIAKTSAVFALSHVSCIFRVSVRPTVPLESFRTWHTLHGRGRLCERPLWRISRQPMDIWLWPTAPIRAPISCESRHRQVTTRSSKGRKRIQLLCCLLNLSFVSSITVDYRINGSHISEAKNHRQLSGLLRDQESRTAWSKVHSRCGVVAAVMVLPAENGAVHERITRNLDSGPQLGSPGST